MGKVFANNLNSLRQANSIFAVFSATFALFPIFVEKNFTTACVYLAVALMAFLLSRFFNYKIQTTVVSDRFILVFSALSYINIMIFGIYMGVWAAPDKLATIILFLIICALLMYINPPQFNFFLTLGAIAVFVTFVILFKKIEKPVYDIANACCSGVFGLYFSWHITKLRMGMEISANMLEEERNKYIDQSAKDELTQMNNRRDFFQTFKRYLSNYRTSDDRLCVSIADIDFFKNYNDHYGHPMGDNCLRAIGSVFNKLKDIMGVYSARVGGEEFAMLWFERDTSHVNDVILCMNGLIKDLKIPHEKSSVSGFVTMSIGVYIETLGEATDAQSLYAFADKALYAAKGSGRNRAIISGRDIKQYTIEADN